MKVNHYECDKCGKAMDVGKETKVVVTYPCTVPVPTRYDKKTRDTARFDLCEECYKKMFKGVDDE